MTTDKHPTHIGAVELDNPQPPELPPLRLFVVHRQGTRMEPLPAFKVIDERTGKETWLDQTDKIVPNDVMVLAHGLDTRDGCLQFFVLVIETVAGEWAVVQYTRRVFKEWVDCEEIVTGPQPKSVN